MDLRVEKLSTNLSNFVLRLPRHKYFNTPADCPTYSGFLRSIIPDLEEKSTKSRVTSKPKLDGIHDPPPRCLGSVQTVNRKDAIGWRIDRDNGAIGVR